MAGRDPCWLRLLPVRCFAIDADTGKPLEPKPKVSCKPKKVTYYDIKKDKNGSKLIVAHKRGGDEKGKNEVVEEKGEKEEGKSGKDEKKEEKNSAPKANVEQKPADAEWTTEEDAKLREMKTANKSWKDIGEELPGRPKWQMQARWKELQNQDSGGGGGDGGGEKNKNDKKKEKGKEKHAAPNHDKNDNQGKKGKDKDKNNKKESTNHHASKPTDKPTKDAKSTTKHPKSTPSAPANSQKQPQETKFTLSDWLTLQEDTLFSFGELQCLSELIMRDQHLTWPRVASAFFDKTGRRVHPEDIREKFEELGQMGGVEGGREMWKEREKSA